ncbi:hypothetical protein PQX77_017588 [Marasmius sp. AFHP31]|nr:hypothetical protein PQX77_017588 [Marasmius sp. AFHP31]
MLMVFWSRFPFSRQFWMAGFIFTERLTGDRISRREELWLSQAGWMFSRSGISRRDWESCSLYLSSHSPSFGIITGIELQLTTVDQRRPFELEDFDEDFDPPCYLFVRPPPKSSDGAPDIETWLRGENLYHYSYDPEGGSAITEQECILLGLPSLISSFQMEYVHWDIEAYDFMEKWQRAKGFDYSTIDYAKSLGFPILEMTIPQDLSNFENLMGMLLSPLLPYPEH